MIPTRSIERFAFPIFLSFIFSVWVIVIETHLKVKVLWIELQLAVASSNLSLNGEILL